MKNLKKITQNKYGGQKGELLSVGFLTDESVWGMTVLSVMTRALIHYYPKKNVSNCLTWF